MLKYFREARRHVYRNSTYCLIDGTLGVEGADALLAQLGRHTTGKGCLYIKKLADVHVTVLETLLRNAVTAKRQQRSQQS